MAHQVKKKPKKCSFLFFSNHVVCRRRCGCPRRCGCCPGSWPAHFVLARLHRRNAPHDVKRLHYSFAVARQGALLLARRVAQALRPFDLLGTSSFSLKKTRNTLLWRAAKQPRNARACRGRLLKRFLGSNLTLCFQFQVRHASRRRLPSSSQYSRVVQAARDSMAC